MSQNPLESDPPEFGSQPHCYIPTEPCDDGGKRWDVTEEFAEYIAWLRKDRKAPRQYAKVSRDFLAKLNWLNRPGSCLDESDNVELSDSVVNEDGVHRIPVGRKVEPTQLPSDVSLIWMGELYSQHDNPASAHRVYFSDVSDLEGETTEPSHCGWWWHERSDATRSADKGYCQSHGFGDSIRG